MQVVACGDHKLLDKFLCVLRAHSRTQNTQKLVLKDGLRRSRNLYGILPPTVEKRLLISLRVNSQLDKTLFNHVYS